VYREVIEERAHHARMAARHALIQPGLQRRASGRASSSQSGVQAC
jgi:hypothetical protein